MKPPLARKESLEANIAKAEHELEKAKADLKQAEQELERRFKDIMNEADEKLAAAIAADRTRSFSFFMISSNSVRSPWASCN